MLTPEKIKAIAESRGETVVSPGANQRASELRGAWDSAPVEDTGNSLLSKTEQALGTVKKVAKDYTIGGAKGAGSTIKGLGTIGQTVLNQTAGRVVNAAQGKGFTPTEDPNSPFEKGTDAEIALSEKLEPTNTTQKIGKTVEQIGEFFIPAGAASKAEKTIDILSKGISSPLGASLARIAGKSVVQGVSAGLVTAAQTGGDLEKTAKTVATAGLVRGGMATIGEGARALKIPERLYSIIFKNSKNDMLSELKSDAILNLQKTNPQKYQEFVDKGIIKVTNGQPIVNETVAEQALDRGLRGSIKNMSNEVVTKSMQAEDDLQRIVKGTNEVVDMSEEQYVNVLKGIAQEYEDVGFGEIASQADDLASRIKAAGGKVDASTALEARRFFDRMRVASSFDKPVSKLSLTQANFKTLGDTLRGRLNKIPGVGEIMKDYSFYIDAMEALAKEAARRGNAQVLGMIDSIFLGGAAISANPIPAATLGVLRKWLSSPQGVTFLAQMLKNASVGSGTSGAIGAGSDAVSEAISEE